MIRSIKQSLLFTGACAALVLASGCDKKKTGGGGGGGGGAWLVGQDGLMADLDVLGRMGDGYDLDSEHDLLGIVCRGLDTAFVVGELGTFLRTFDGGATWDVVDLATTRTLRSVATSGPSTVYVAGDGILVMSPDSGRTFTSLPVDPSTSWLAVASGHGSDGALALDAGGQVWRYDAEFRTMGAVTSLTDARVVAMSHDGARAVVAGNGRTLLRSEDAGRSWRQIDLGRELDLYDAWVTQAGDTVAVGAGGVIARVDIGGAVVISEVGSGALRAVHVNAQGRGLAAGDDGEVLSTTDGGRTWSPLPVALSGTVFGVDEVAGDGHL
ncbi:MAG TPA: hypothetical protein VM734_09630 [Kofleriaceae bacterium]|jgi:photosystem II stability/assembly factor-like uncharacterized protein|nr:hypothetical protein [Kofleriaceae bacterium]